mmetsp:Transcript_20500/g.49926  ORF Transcript_20500/g.49926 Transcript_20500/m.49926 type:complete len:222 (+) Transcript_20500:611-1276(+)
MSGDAHGPVLRQSLEEVLLDRVVVEWTVDVSRSDGCPGCVDGPEVLLAVELALVAALGVHGIALPVRHLVALEVHARTAHVHVVLEAVGEEVHEHLGLIHLTAIHVEDGVELHRRHLAQVGQVLAVARDKLGAALAPLELRGALARDGPQGRLATVEHRHVMTAVQQLTPQIEAREAGAADEQHLHRLVRRHPQGCRGTVLGSQAVQRGAGERGGRQESQG